MSWFVGLHHKISRAKKHTQTSADYNEINFTRSESTAGVRVRCAFFGVAVFTVCTVICPWTYVWQGT